MAKDFMEHAMEIHFGTPNPTPEEIQFDALKTEIARKDREVADATKRYIECEDKYEKLLREHAALMARFVELFEEHG